MKTHYSFSFLAAISAAALASSAAVAAQDYRPDGEGYPCKAAAKLAVVQDGQSFAIRQKDERPATVANPDVRTIAIGAGLKLDVRLPNRGAAQTMEAANASHR